MWKLGLSKLSINLDLTCSGNQGCAWLKKGNWHLQKLELRRFYFYL